MKRPASGRAGSPQENGEPRRSRSVKWDEDNLRINEGVKAELNPRKIDEPKTPYHGPQDSDEEPSLGEAGMAPLTLEDDAAIEQLSAQRNGTSVSTSKDEERPYSHHGWSDSDRGEQSSGAVSNSHSLAGCHGEEAESDPQTHKRSREKKRRFEAHRRQHYDMRDALKRGKALLSEDPEAGRSQQHGARVQAGAANGTNSSD